MELKVVFSLLFLALLIIPGGHCARFEFKNNCGYTIWPATTTNPDKPRFPTGGFELANGATKSYDSAANWGGRFWGRTGCTNNNGQFSCMTGDCGRAVECTAGGATPTSLAEFTLQGDGGKDFYDISLVDGFNLPVGVTPQGQGASCPSTTCRANVNANCPADLALKGPNGATVGCKSACVAFGQPQYCCTGEYNNAERCQATDYSRVFKNACPQAYSYAYDDRSSTFTCPTGANYLITFCP